MSHPGTRLTWMSRTGATKMGKPFTPTEMRRFRKLKKEYMREGYPLYEAESRAWDIVWNDHNLAIGVKK